MITTKYIFSAWLLAASLSTVQAQSTKVNSLETKGNVSYANLLYADAMTYYKQAYNTTQTTELIAKIADCYWLLRNYDSSYVWYAKLPQDRLNENKQEKVRLAELTATMGHYLQASESLKDVSGYSSRAMGFTKTAIMLRDSAQWAVQYLSGINTDYFREFSPVLVDTGLIWTTNQPKTFSQNGIMGWDKMGFNRLMKIIDLQQLKPEPIKSRQTLDQYADTNRPVKLAKHYTLADVDLLGQMNLSSALLKRLKDINTIAKPVVFTDKLDYNVAHASYSHSEKNVLFSVNQQGKLKEQTRNLALASASLNGVVLSKISFLLEQNAAYSNMHPALHPNGNIVVFSSNRDGGKGGFDLYMISKNDEGKWSDPQPLQGVNTLGNELFPSFGGDGKFYFSSDAHPGLGGLDIYAAAIENGRVKNIRHLSYPVNSAYDDFGLTINADGNKGYFSSDRLGTDDIYMFEKEVKLVMLTGKVNSSATKEGKPGVEIVINEKVDNAQAIGNKVVLKSDDAAGKTIGNTNEDLKTYPLNNKTGISSANPTLSGAIEELGSYDIYELSGEQSASSVGLLSKSGTQIVKTDARGEYSLWVKPNRSYELIISDGSSPKETMVINTYGSGNKGDIGSIAMNDKLPEPPKKVFDDKQYIVYFAFDKADIRKKYSEILNEVIEVMRGNSEIVCELTGHTDQFGKEEYNDGLAARRVDNVKEYLETNGIGSRSLVTDSFGEKKLVKVYNSKSKSEINRRVEITLKNR